MEYQWGRLGRVCGVLIIIAISCLDVHGAAATDQQLETKQVVLGAQGNRQGNYLDVFSGKSFSARQASDNSAAIQLMYVYGRNSGGNLFLTGSSAIRRYARSVQERINSWSNRWEGQMINIGKAPDTFDGLHTLDDLRKAYAEHRELVQSHEGYKLPISGPADGLQSLNEGDVVLLHLYGEQAFVAFHIHTLVPGTDGSISFDIKVGKYNPLKDAGQTYVQAAPDAGGDWQPGTTYADDQYWHEYTVGDMPLVLSVPHGGAMNPLSIPDRNCPKAVRGTDMRTIELTREIQKVLIQEYGLRPHVIVSNLSRRKIDLNRGISLGTCDHEEAKPAWQQYHTYMDTAVALAGRQHDQVFFLDIHAHAHQIQRLELGYLINGKALESAFQDRDLSGLAKKSSLTNVIPEGEEQRLKELLFGEDAFGTLAENRGIRAIPSKQDPYPQEGERYLSRGYITQRYTSTEYPHVHGIQVEFGREVRSDEQRVAFARSFAKTIIEYMSRRGMITVQATPGQ